jgi:hypothetical protein
MAQQTECCFDLDPDTNTPICKVHRVLLEEIGLHEVSAVPGPPDTIQWRCPISGINFLQNSNFPNH